MQPSLDCLRKAFPSGLPDRDYMPLLAVMYDDYSDRQLAALVAEFTGRHPIDVSGDAAHAQGSLRPEKADVERVRLALRAAGYEDLPD